MHVLMGMMSVEIDEEHSEAIVNATTQEEVTEALVTALRSGESPKLIAVRALQAEGDDLLGDDELGVVRQEVDGTLIGVLTVDLMRYVSLKPEETGDYDPRH